MLTNNISWGCRGSVTTTVHLAEPALFGLLSELCWIGNKLILGLVSIAVVFVILFLEFVIPLLPGSQNSRYNKRSSRLVCVCFVAADVVTVVRVIVFVIILRWANEGVNAETYQRQSSRLTSDATCSLITRSNITDFKFGTLSSNTWRTSSKWTVLQEKRVRYKKTERSPFSESDLCPLKTLTDVLLYLVRDFFEISLGFTATVSGTGSAATSWAPVCISIRCGARLFSNIELMTDSEL